VFKIEANKHYPIEGDKEFCVELVTPSQSDKLRVLSGMGKADGPVDDKNGEKSLTTNQSIAYSEGLMRCSIVKVHGMEYLGKKVETAEDFIKHATSDISESVLSAVLKLSRKEDAEKK